MNSWNSLKHLWQNLNSIAIISVIVLLLRRLFPLQKTIAREAFVCHASSPREKYQKAKTRIVFEQWSQKQISFLRHKTIISFSLHYRASKWCKTLSSSGERESEGRKSFCSGLKIRIEFQLVERVVSSRVSNELSSLVAEGRRHVVQGFAR